MSTSASDIVENLSILLEEAGYTFHEREVTEDGEDIEDEDTDVPAGTVYWFVWGKEGMAGYEVGDDYATEIDAIDAAMGHWFENARIPAKPAKAKAV